MSKTAHIVGALANVGLLGASASTGRRQAGDDILQIDNWPGPREFRPIHLRDPYRGPAPNDIGPVIDTAPESKRARRRRLAKQGGQDHG
jgi:hypothetical protein